LQKIADLRANADKRLKAVTLLRGNYQKKWSELSDAMKQRKDITASLEQVQNEIAGIRSKKNLLTEKILNEFLPEDMKVTIDFRAGRDTEKFSNIIYSIFGAKGNQAKKISKIIETHTTPISFATMMGKHDFSELLRKSIADDNETLTFEDEDITLCINKTLPFEQDTSADVPIIVNDGKRLEMVLNIQETEWDDNETILLNGGLVNEKSPGQRSSAMLPLIALAEETPLVIDQPEDNLDKRVISHVLMRVLAKLKEHRQIIVCTHDPNILVGGDAEQVIVLEAENDKKGNVGIHGSIDNDDIVKTVVDLFEGGVEAFEARRKRYRERTW
jgi:predicted ATP-dependent endonuclease of OLD family